MKVFLTGGTGFIGSHIVMELLSKGDTATILARNPQKIPQFLGTPGIAVIQGSLDNHEVIRAMTGHDACIHNALYWEDPSSELELKDARASVQVFEAAADAGVGQLIYTSSTAVHRPFQAHMDETMRLTPTDLYAATKAASEAFLFAFSYTTPMRCNIVRPGPTVGAPAVAGGPAKSDRRFRSIVDAAMRGDEIRVPRCDGRQFIGAKDLAKVYVAALHSEANRETYLAVGRDFISWKEIAEYAVKLTDSRSQLHLEDGDFWETPPMFDCTKIQREFNLSFSSSAAVREHLRYLTQHGF